MVNACVFAISSLRSCTWFIDVVYVSGIFHRDIFRGPPSASRDRVQFLDVSAFSKDNVRVIQSWPAYHNASQNPPFGRAKRGLLTRWPDSNTRSLREQRERTENLLIIRN